MENKISQTIENYFNTKNDHWNCYTFDLICDAIRKGVFDDLEMPLQMFGTAYNIFMDQFDTPIKAVYNFNVLLAENDFSIEQKIFIYKWVIKYYKSTDFDGVDCTEIVELLKSYEERLNKQSPQYKVPKVEDLRIALKEIIQKELAQLPEILKDMDANQRLTIVCKLIPYTLPKVKTIHFQTGESEAENGSFFSDLVW